MKKRALIIFFSLFVSISSAQIIESPKNDLRNFFKTGSDLFSEPENFDLKDWLVLSSTLGLTVSSFLVDEDIQSFTLENRSAFQDVLFKIDDLYHIEYMAASIVTLYIYGAASKNSDVRNLGLKLTEATIYAGSIALLGKFLFGRGRPQNLSNATYFQPLNTTWEFTSLPSGHTSLSFAYSTVMASVYNNFFWKFSWYSLAALVGAARIYNNAHWFSDVVLGGAIGYFVGDFINKHYTNQKEKNINIPIDTLQNFSISFVFAF